MLNRKFHIKFSKKLLILSLIIAVFVISVTIYYKKGLNYWFSSYIIWFIKKHISQSSPNLIHIMFLMIDHFEPTKKENVIPWLTKYPKIAFQYKDSDGYHPRYTWAFPIEQYHKNHLFIELISNLCRQGLGEIEVQFHHRNDNSESFRKRLREGISNFQKHGACITIDGKTAFAFVHGNWALDNSVKKGDKNYCGVNNELSILKEEGCFADFTFPANGSMAQPSKINTIYYAKDDPFKPKSYNDGIDVEVGKPPYGDLMIFEGPLFINWRDWKHVLYPSIDDAQLQANNPPTPIRIDEWIKAGIHVKGKPDWIFVKVFTHGASPKNWRMLFDYGFKNLFDYLTKKYNDGQKYLLHFVTAREAYNIVKAAEAGLKGNPNQFRNYLIKPYKNTIRENGR